MATASYIRTMPRTYPVTREGWPFVGAGVAVAVAAGAVGIAPLVWAGSLWAGACALFFRNPQREVPAAPGLVVSPADGKIVAIETVDEPFFGRGRMQRVSIFLSVANVHINRTPLAGEVKGQAYHPGRFHLAFAPQASTENERNAIWIQGAAPAEETVMVQIAGLVARRIVSYVHAGDHVERGARCGLIRFGSRVDLYLPMTCALAVNVGDRVAGGESTIGRFAGVAA